jgi:hypothetical protein
VAVRVDHLILLVLCLQPNNLKHTTMYLHLAVYTSVALIADVAWRRDDTAESLGAVMTPPGSGPSSPRSPYWCSGRPRRFHSADHAGLEDHYHWVLQIVVAGSLTATVATDRRRLAQQCRTRWCAQ